MTTGNTNDGKAMPPASAGSHGSNGLVAYYVHGSEYDTGCEFAFVTLLREHAEASGGTVETLVQITDEEREAVRYFAHMQPHSKHLTQRHAATLCGLLDRLK